MECPFCDRPLSIGDETSPRAGAVGLVYLRARCVPCDARIEAAGASRAEADADLAAKVERRRGTDPARWRIRPRAERRRRR